jgi:hypothetical protein
MLERASFARMVFDNSIWFAGAIRGAVSVFMSTLFRRA